MPLLFMISALAVCAIFSQLAFAQDDDFISSLLSNLDSVGLTSFTDVVRQVQADSSETTFLLSISNSSTPVTLFVPANDAFVNPDANDFGYPYQASNTDFLSSLLLYHLLPGTYTEDILGVGNNHTVAPTALQGRSMCFLENNQPQSMALGHTANGIEVYNQYGTTAVQQVTYNFQNVQIYVLDTVIGIPGPFSFGANFLGLNQLMEFLNTTGIPDLDNQHGLTVFAPSDDAFNAIQSQMPSLSPSSIFANHVIFGRTIYYPDFQSDSYSASSGCYLTFTPTDDLGYTITLNSVTVKIIRSDFLINNGVIHIVDGVFWNTTRNDVALPPPPNAATSSASAVAFATSATAPWASPTASGAVSVTVSSPPTPKLSLGTIVGIVAIVVFALSMPLIGYLVWKYRRAIQGAQVRHRDRISIFDLPPAALRTNPFPVRPSKTHSTDSEAQLSMSDVRFARNSDGGTTSTRSLLQQPGIANVLPNDTATPLVSNTRGKLAKMKPPFSGLPYSPIPTTTSGGSKESPIELVQTSYMRSGQAQPHAPPVPPIPMTPELVDHLWHQFASRIDRGPRKSEAPPTYLSSAR